MKKFMKGRSMISFNICYLMFINDSAYSNEWPIKEIIVALSIRDEVKHYKIDLY